MRNIGHLGQTGARDRMAELLSRIEQMNPKPAAPANSLKSLPGKLPQTGDGAFEAALSGAIGKPLSPFGDGMSVTANTTPQIRSLIAQAANEAGVDPKLFDALVAQESSYNPNARSGVGAMGLSQLMPGTARELGVQNPYDPEQNLRGGARYLRKMLDQFGGDTRLALAAYNAGPGAVQRAGNQVPQILETQNYVTKIMSLYEAGR